MSNIKKNTNKIFDIKLNNCNYWDLYLSMDASSDCFVCNNLITGDVVATFDFDNISGLCSTVTWENATSFNKDLCDIGLTGYDNRFVDWYTGETFNPSGDTTFCVKRVSGDTYCYEMNHMPAYGVEPEHIQFCGGFFQGFYRLHGYDYNVLPNMYYRGWTKEFWIKRSDCPSGESVTITGETITYQETDLNVIETTEIWTLDVISGGTCTDKLQLNDIYPDNKGIFYFWGLRAENKFCAFSPFAELKTCEGLSLAPKITEIPFEPDINPFLYYTRRTAHCLPEPNSTAELIDCCDGIINNALAFRATDDGEIGLRLMTTTGECMLVGESIMFSGNPVVEEFYSKQNIIKKDKWYHVTYRFEPYERHHCIGYRVSAGVLSVFVDGFLKLKIDGFPEFIPYELNEIPEKQLGVPFNISLGGGTQGLLESYTFSGLTEAFDLTGYTLCNYISKVIAPCTFNGIVINGERFESPKFTVHEADLIKAWLEMHVKSMGEIEIEPYYMGDRDSIKITFNAVLDKLDYILLEKGVSCIIQTNCIDVPPYNGRCGYLEDNFAGTFIGGIGEFRLHDRPLCLQEIRCNFQLERAKYNRLRDKFECE